MSFSTFFTSYFQRRKTLSVAVDCCDCADVMGINRFGEIYPVIDYSKITSCGPMIHDFGVLSLLEYSGCHALNGKEWKSVSVWK